MSLLHENREEFRNAVYFTAGNAGSPPDVVEKDYYVTLTLKRLAERLPFLVFKGGTSLSKCYKLIRRFSEDVDVTTDVRISQSQRENVKSVVKKVAEELSLSIPNIGETKSRRNYNRYLLVYDPVVEKLNPYLQPAVVLETTFTTESFPTVSASVNSFIGEALYAENPDIANLFELAPFSMKVQGLDRALIDKVFAICDYYLKEDAALHSRHIYDVYKLCSRVQRDENFRRLIKRVREVRAAKATACPSAQPGIDISGILSDLVENGFYKSDYEQTTSRLLGESVSYEAAIETIKEIAISGAFDE